MTTFTPLSRMRFASKSCICGAVIIGLIGLILIILYVSTLWSTLRSPGLLAQSQNPSLVLSNVLGIALITILTIFFSLILYALGTFLRYISEREKVPEEDHERLEIIAIPSLQSKHEGI